MLIVVLPHQGALQDVKRVDAHVGASLPARLAVKRLVRGVRVPRVAVS